MTPTTGTATQPLEIERARQLFRFLKDFAQRDVALPRSLSEQPWCLPLRELPRFPTISVGSVTLAAVRDIPDADASPLDAPLLRIGRPTLTPAPPPPEVLNDFLQRGWEDPDAEVCLAPPRVRLEGGQTIPEPLEDDPARLAALESWRSARAPWAEAERPARAAMRAFEQIYDLHARLERESERLELLLGDGRLLWRRPEATFDHPLILQRVDLVFDPDRAEFRLTDSDRAPELYGALLQNGAALHGQQVTKLRAELEQGGYHPLEGPGTSAFLRRIAQLLGPHGTFRDGSEPAVPGDDPIVIRDPVLILRARVSGFPAAFDRVLQDLETATSVPVSLARLVGVEAPAPPDDSAPTYSPWGEPPDVLLSKPANAEQVRIARALERHHAVLVQGPPGTGKSHTIANLIGHLVAQGKRVLVTSHTSKALRVLRAHIVDTLRPLCVAVLDQDLDSRTQLEQSVRGILSRLTESSEEQLEEEAASLERARLACNQRLEVVTRSLRETREAEYAPIAIAGESLDPSEAARWVREHQDGYDWIPGPVDPDAPLPLAPREVQQLYALNGQLSLDDERELEANPPDPAELPAPEAFAALVQSLEVEESPELASFWGRTAKEADLPILEALEQIALAAAAELERSTPWQRALIAAGHARGSERELWVSLARAIEDAEAVRNRARPMLVERRVEVTAGLPAQRVRVVSEEMATHVARGRTLGWVQRLLHAAWKQVLRGTLVNGRPPRTEADFRAICAHLELEESRERLGHSWSRLAEPAGLPALRELGPGLDQDPEPVLAEYGRRFEVHLDWWETRWKAVETKLADCGLRWDELRQWELARSEPQTPFERDAAVLGRSLPKVARARAAIARRLCALRELEELASSLDLSAGWIPAALHAAVVQRDVPGYDAGLCRLQDLTAKIGSWRLKRSLLDRLSEDAPNWADAVRRRTGAHGESLAPGDPCAAWRWRQLAQEIERRAALVERSLTLQLQRLKRELQETTLELIDRRAWLAQKRRTRLPERQALQGWADTVRKIGKGTGKRVPELQAKARRLLSQARDGVPVWIMPLQRVAESFDPARARFDVVIVDEASQSDVTGLLSWYLGERLAVVGDHEQVSPMAVGLEVAPLNALIAQHLDRIPNSHLYDGTTSIYDLARQSFGGTIALREHFRCVPDIIEFSNGLSYNLEIRPLRNPASAPRPHVVEFVAHPELGPVREGQRNEAEARALVALLKASIELPENSGRTFGAISLLGDEQAWRIQELASRLIGAVELERRRFAAGNPAQFQGDERDVVFLSMVDAPTGSPLTMKQSQAFKQRYNVAASRARDQLWLVHSLDPAQDLQEGDLRRRLIDHVRDPSATKRALMRAEGRAESTLEAAVRQRLLAAGYSVAPRTWIGRYRIDIVVSGASGQVGVECDGDESLPLERIPDDMARQAVLERVGWRFVRIRGTRFFRDPDGTLAWVRQELARLGVEPRRSQDVAAEPYAPDEGLRERILRRAREIMRDQGWLPKPPSAQPERLARGARDPD